MLDSLLQKEFRVSQELAMRLERVFKIEWEFWINAQRAYDGWREVNHYKH